MINVIIRNSTGSFSQDGILYPESGVIKIGASFTHITQEISFGKVIFEAPELVATDAPEEKKEEPKKKVVTKRKG